jgi:hypothetical protein
MKSIIDNWNKYKNEVLSESSFSRIKRMVDEGKQPFIVISAARDDLGKDEAGNQDFGELLSTANLSAPSMQEIKSINDKILDEFRFLQKGETL